MSKKSTRRLLMCLIYGLAVILVALLAVAKHMGENNIQLQHPTVPAVTTLPAQTTIPTTQAPTTQPTTAPPTTQPTTQAPTTEPPEPTEYVLTFVGDCTFADTNENAHADSFSKVVGDDYDYPFADVVEYFRNDDCTFVNLECTLSDRGVRKNKEYTYRGDPEYINILTRGSVEFANIGNNHSTDYGLVSHDDTVSLLNEAGIYYAEPAETVLFTTESGLTIGVYVNVEPFDTSNMAADVKRLRDQGAEIIVGCFHWGMNYYYRVFPEMTKVGHLAIDVGIDIVYGHHSHLLQKVEEYNGGIIYYGVGNFCYGGSRNPRDKDTAIFQQTVIRDSDGTVRLGELNVIPCHVSGILSYGNDYQPTPMEVGSKAYERALSKLFGGWTVDNIK